MATFARAARGVGVAATAIVAALLLVPQQLSAAGPDTGMAPRGAPASVEQALSELQPSADGTPHLYFVGFAGYGPEAVFKREVVAVRKLFNEKFGTAGRSVALINHKSTVDEFPLASAQNLERALHHVGQIMDPEIDTLFLFLTSHGEQALLAVVMPGMQLQHLTPAMLKIMLDRSGIKNRVIVISACHSGSFIPALASPTTLVIAAARADRASFGCADKREWTYFGDAYFNRALRRETSFLKAFDRAKRLVERWERRERLMPSLPQIEGGEALALKE
jgi:Peptidase C13 family